MRARGKPFLLEIEQFWQICMHINIMQEAGKREEYNFPYLKGQMLHPCVATLKCCDPSNCTLSNSMREFLQFERGAQENERKKNEI